MLNIEGLPGAIVYGVVVPLLVLIYIFVRRYKGVDSGASYNDSNKYFMRHVVLCVSAMFVVSLYAIVVPTIEGGENTERFIFYASIFISLSLYNRLVANKKK